HLMKSLDRWPKHRGVNRAGADTVDPDVEGGIVDCTAFSELSQRRLAQPVHRAATLADKHLVRSHQDNVAISLFSHDGENFFQNIERTFQIDGQNALKLLDAGVLNVGKQMNAGGDE